MQAASLTPGDPVKLSPQLKGGTEAMAKITRAYSQAVDALVEKVEPIPSFNFYVLNEYDQLCATLASLVPGVLEVPDAYDAVSEELIGCAYEMGVGKKEVDPTNFREVLRKNLVNLAESLPKDYTLEIELPEFPILTDFTIELSKGIWLIRDKATRQTNALLSALMKEEPKAGTFLRIATSGYGNGSPNSPAVAAGLSIARVVAFLVLSTAGTGVRPSFKSSRSRAFLRQRGETFDRQVELPEALARCFGQVIADETKWLVYDSRRGKSQSLGKAVTLLGDPGRPAETDDERVEALTMLLRLAVPLLGKTSHEDFESVAAAIEWYEDSQYSDNQTFAYLAACIGLEALLGGGNGEKLDQLSRRLGDRYAFMVGRSRSEREKLRVDYKRALDLRGELVHGRQRRLKKDQRAMLQQVQSMLWMVIRREINQILRD